MQKLDLSKLALILALLTLALIVLMPCLLYQIVCFVIGGC